MSDGMVPRVQISAEPTTTWSLAENLPWLLGSLSPDRLRQQRWFGSKAQEIARVTPRDYAPFGLRPPSLLVLVDVALGDGRSEAYYLPLAARREEEAAAALSGDLSAAFLGLDTPGGSFLIYDACADAEFDRQLFRQVERGGRLLTAGGGAFTFGNTAALTAGQPLGQVHLLRGEQSNTSVIYDRAFILKTYRKLQGGISPDLEVPRFLTTRANFAYTPPLAGYVEYASGGFVAAIGTLQVFVANAGDGWTHTVEHVRDLYHFVQQAAQPPEDAAGLVRSFSAEYLRSIRRLGEITGQLHRALVSAADDPAFAPEPVQQADLEQWVAGASAQLAVALQTVAAAAGNYPSPVRAQLEQVVAAEAHYRQRLAGLLALSGVKVDKIRQHGDYHLGQVLRTGDDFVVLDFEGEPARPLAERRAKQLALKDVAGMLRSFDYAVYAALFELGPAIDPAPLEGVGRVWESMAGEAYLAGYLAETHARGVSFLPSSLELIRRAVGVFLLDKAIYELSYEVNNRPTWLRIPLQYLTAH